MSLRTRLTVYATIFLYDILCMRFLGFSFLNEILEPVLIFPFFFFMIPYPTFVLVIMYLAPCLLCEISLRIALYITKHFMSNSLPLMDKILHILIIIGALIIIILYIPIIETLRIRKLDERIKRKRFNSLKTMAENHISPSAYCDAPPKTRLLKYPGIWIYQCAGDDMIWGTKDDLIYLDRLEK